MAQELLFTVIIYALATYALATYLVQAHVLFRSREWAMKKTPYLRQHGVHLLECRLCVGFWCSLAIVFVPIEYAFWLAFLGLFCFIIAKDQ